MKTVKKTATVTTAYGNVLPEPVKFNYSFEELELGDEIPEKEKLDADDIRQFVNQKRNSSARAAQQTKELDAAGISKPTLEDPAEQLRQMVKVLVAAGKSQEVAEQIAKSALGQ